MYSLNPSTADIFCKETRNLAVPNVFDVEVTTELPLSLVNAIQIHGKVEVCKARFSVADGVATISGSVAGNLDGNGLNARFSGPAAICVDTHESCFYVCESNNNCIKKLTVQGGASTFANIGMSSPYGIAMNDTEKTFFVTNYAGHTISKISSSRTTSIFAGSGRPACVDGAGATASFYYPIGIAIDPKTGTLFVSEYFGCIVRKITPQGGVTTFAGSVQGLADGTGKKAKFNCPWGMCFDESTQSLLVCDSGNSKLRRIQLNGIYLQSTFKYNHKSR